MKPFLNAKSFAALLASILTVTTACAAPSGGHLPPTSDSDPPQDNAADLRAYYETVIAELNQELSQWKQENYVIRKEYESRIDELESRLAAAEAEPTDTDIPVSAPAETEPAESTAPNRGETSFHYVIENGKAIICAYTGNASAVVIPREIVGYPVGRIEDNAFRGSPVTSILVPDTVTAIGWFAFAHCPGLTAVTLPPSVESIGYGAFDGCPRLTLICPADSYAAQYAKSFAIPHREE